MHIRPARDTIMVVDDSPETLSMLTDALEAAGMTVLVAIEGTQALTMAERVTPDAILMDAVMPGMDGFETTRRLKRTAASHVPVIFMTGLTETAHIVEAFAAGGVDYVTKPIVPDELLARMRVHLANARVAHGARTALDVSGRYLFAADVEGRPSWCTPQAAKLLATAFDDFSAEVWMLPANARAWLQRRMRGETAVMDSIDIAAASGERILRLSYMGRIGPGEFLLRLTEGADANEEQVLRDRLALTLREAEVLLWTARGKSNRDIGVILTLSPRTVNKHLEQIFSKLGVENRTAASAIAMRTLSDR
jgi:DNA-binding response OmpR family regulator/DNA-binding CsgD family transcriptional regulator